jgi:uncharacterized protein YktA (UPF0223 family)
VNSLIHSYVSEPGKTRGAIGFAAVAGVPKGHLRHFKINKAGYRKFKAGEFEIVDLDAAVTFAERLRYVAAFTTENTWKDRDFIRALSVVYTKGIKHETLMERLQRFGSVIYRRASLTDYLRTFEDVYNRGVPTGNVLRFY